MRSAQVDESHLGNIMKKYIWLLEIISPLEMYKIYQTNMNKI